MHDDWEENSFTPEAQAMLDAVLDGCSFDSGDSDEFDYDGLRYDGLRFDSGDLNGWTFDY